MKHFQSDFQAWGHAPRLIKAFSDEQGPVLERAFRYHHKTKVPAIVLLAKLFSKLPEGLRGASQLSILVIGAGSFPSYRAVLAALMHECPKLKSVEFVLVEPVEVLTQIFLKHFSKFKSSQFSINIKIDYREAQVFLQQEKQAQFDIVYFEHPEVMVLPILLAKIGWQRYQICRALRESLPAVLNVIKPTGWIVASCMSKHEMKQLQSLLYFSGHPRASLFSVSRLRHFLYGGPFTSGLCCPARPLDLSLEQNYQERALGIKKSDHHLCYAIMLSFIFYIIFCFHVGPGVRAISVFFMLAQLYLHCPGKKGTIIKIGLLLCQVALV